MPFAVFLDQIVHGLFRSMNRRNSHRARSSALSESVLAPTEERYRQGAIERLNSPIADETGSPARPYRTIDILATMERRGSITQGMRRSGEDFRVHFATAQLDPLRAFDYSRPRDNRTGSTKIDGLAGLRIEGAREHVWRAIVAVGGPNSPAGSCLWHVIGWERSLKEWALERGWNGRRVSQEAASGILIAALGSLEAYYRQGTQLRKTYFRN